MDYHSLNEVTPLPSAAMSDMIELQYELESKAGKWFAATHVFFMPLAAGCRPQFAFL